jgi:hypothetical protein
VKRTEKIQKLTEIWCNWNQRVINGNYAMYEIGKVFKRETLATWNNLPHIKTAIKDLEKEASRE